MFGWKKSSRLIQWDGRRRSSRSEDPVLPRLWQRSTLFRLGTVLLTVLAATCLACFCWPAQTFRVGQICKYEIRSRVYFEVVNQALTLRHRDEAVERLPAELRSDPVACEAARLIEPPVVDRYPAGALLVPRGQPITEAQLALLHQEYAAFLDSRSVADHLHRTTSLFLVLLLLAILVILYVIRFQPSLAHSLSKISAICGLALVTLALAFLCNCSPYHAILVPLTVTALILTIAYNPQFALVMSIGLTLAALEATGARLADLLVTLGGQTTAILVLRSVRTRTRLVEVGAIAGFAYAAMTISTGLHSGQTGYLIAMDSLRGLAWGVLSGFLVSGMLPLVERCFGVVTDVSLIELGDGSHPLLQELVRRAPGTYTHSMTVATLAEPAAEAIGANPLLARVGSYFHDIGKMLKPHYFIENQTGENRHDSLEPALSTLIIIGHVKDGVALAEQYRLPRPIIDFIQQHHGTTLVEYFYREALRQQEAQGHSTSLADGQPNPLEASFRYPGPKPQTRESGIVLLSDAVESSSRALASPTPGSLRKLVHDLLMKRLLDGQFEESGLTLTELHIIEETLAKGLIALYHSRIKYPEASTRKAS
jgi:putative nucleotidyltransferase with HDIG domain